MIDKEEDRQCLSTTVAIMGLNRRGGQTNDSRHLKNDPCFGTLSTIGYGIGRTVGQLASQALTGVFSNVGLEITENIAKMCNMGAVGAITIGVFSTVQFVKLVCKGESLKTAAIQVGKQALFSLSLLVVSITAQGIFGGPSGIIVSVGVGVIFVTYTIADTVHQRNYSEKLRVYMIEKCKPIFA